MLSLPHNVPWFTGAAQLTSAKKTMLTSVLVTRFRSSFNWTKENPQAWIKLMSTQTSPSEYLVICRGLNESLSPEELQNAMKQFNAWFERMSDQGKMNGGHQLGPEGKVLSGRKGVTDGPFAESKEGIAGYWFIHAASLEEAVEIAKGDPLLDYGHTVEIRPILLQAAELVSKPECTTANALRPFDDAEVAFRT